MNIKAKHETKQKMKQKDQQIKTYIKAAILLNSDCMKNTACDTAQKSSV